MLYFLLESTFPIRLQCCQPWGRGFEGYQMKLASSLNRLRRSTNLLFAPVPRTKAKVRERQEGFDTRRSPKQQLSLIQELGGDSARKRKSNRKPPAGVATNELVFSAHQGDNSDLFPQILSLYVPEGSKVADVTYGKGVFWKNVDKSKYRIFATDLKTRTDCRNLPYTNEFVDSVVLDPPYMHTPGGTAHVAHQNYEDYYRNNQTGNGTSQKYHEAVLDLYFKAGDEAWRVLRKGGIFIVKCQDEVCACKQRLTHVELINQFTPKKFIVEDLFILLRRNKPGVSRILKQRHARKNHSYFLVFRKVPGPSRWLPKR